MHEPIWSLVQYSTDSSESVRLGISSPDGVFALPAGWPATATELLDSWQSWEDQLRSLDLSTLEQVHKPQLHAPITYPRKVICAGANYYDHAAEMGTERPNPEAAPYFFLKPPTTAIVGPDARIELPSANANVDWEAELGIVIKDRCKAISPEEARDHIAGYVVANDVSARGLFPRPEAVAPPFGWDWYGHKSPDGFCPIGPGFVPYWNIQDPQNLRITLAVNGVMKQDSNTSNLVVGIDRLVSYASQYVTLEPGDIILTGTPAGVGMPKKEFLSSGDVMTVSIEGLGRLENTVF